MKFDDCRSTRVGGHTTYLLVDSNGKIVATPNRINFSRSGNHWEEEIQDPIEGHCVVRINRNRSGREFEATVASTPVPEWATQEFLSDIVKAYSRN